MDSTVVSGSKEQKRVSLKERSKRFVRQVKVLHPAINETKFAVQFAVRKLMRRPHEDIFYAFRELEVDGNDEDHIFLDIGANRGQTIESVRMFRGFRLLSLEPQPYLAERLRSRYRKVRNVSVHNVGVSSSKGWLKLFVPFYNGVCFDGLASLDREDATRFFFKRRQLIWFNENLLEVKEVNVECLRVDELKVEPLVLKADVQGAEMLVLESARETIQRAGPMILLETPSEGAEIAFLREFGYRPYIFDRGRLVAGTGRREVLFLTPKHETRFGSILQRER